MKRGLAARRRPTAAIDSRTVLGVDPGLRVTGWGIVSAAGDEMRALDSGVISVPGEHPVEQRLHHIFRELCGVIERWRPTEVAIEAPFVGKNARSAFAIGEARAVALLAAAQAGLLVRTYAPAEVKLSVTGYGRSDKTQVQELVRVQLGLETPPEPVDASDALAVAICHHLRRRSDARLEQAR